MVLCFLNSAWAQTPVQLKMQKSHARFVLGSGTAPKLVSGLNPQKIGGVSLTDQVYSLNYGASVGRLDHSTAENLQYGAETSQAWVSANLLPSFSLEGLYESTQGQHQVGVGGRYDFHDLGDVAINYTAEQHNLDAHWDLGRWGKWGASYSGTTPSFGSSQHTFGLNQQFWYSPNLRVDIDAQRQTRSGDYNVGLRFSLPLF